MDELDLKKIVDIFLGKKILIIIITLLFFVFGSVYSLFLITPLYKASTTLVLSSISDSEAYEAITQTDINLNKNLVTTYGVIIKSRTVAKQVISELNLKMDEKDFIDSIYVSDVKDTEILQVDVENENAETATIIANKIAQVFGEEVKRIYGIQNVNVVDIAEIPQKPYNVNFFKDVIIFTFVGLFLSIIISFFIYYFDTTVKSSEELEQKLNLPVLSCIAKYEE